MDFGNDSESWSIFPITDNLSSSYVDTNKLLLDESYRESKYPIGMGNFRSKSSFGSTSVKTQNSILNNRLVGNYSLPNSYKHNDSKSVARLRWRLAASKVKFLNDPWCDFKIDLYPAEVAIRHRYNAIKKQWIKDECIVKMEPKQFANGAMRACFRL